MATTFNFTFQQKNFVTLLLKNDYFGDGTIKLDGKETHVEIYIRKIPTIKNIKKTFFKLISSLEEIGFISDTYETDEGEIYLYITDENLKAVECLQPKSVEKGDIKLTDLEQKFYNTFIRDLSADEIENNHTEIYYKDGIEGMTIYQIGAILSTLKEKGVITNIDKKNKVATIKILK